MQQACRWLIWCNQDISWFKTKSDPRNTILFDLFISLDLPGAAGLSNTGSPSSARQSLCWMAVIFHSLSAHSSAWSAEAGSCFSLCLWVVQLLPPAPKTQRRRWRCQVPGLLFWCCVEIVDHSAQLRLSSVFRSGLYDNTLASHEKTKKPSYQSVISEVRRWRTGSIYNACHNHF